MKNIKKNIIFFILLMGINSAVMSRESPESTRLQQERAQQERAQQERAQQERAQQERAQQERVQEEEKARSVLRSKLRAKFLASREKEPKKVAIKVAASDKTSLKKVEKRQALEKQDSTDLDKIIDDFINSVDDIKTDCKSHPGQENDDSHSDEHRKQVEKAFIHYKKLYNFFKTKKKLISKKDNDRVQPFVHKIFNCKNIKNMAWSGHLDQKNKQVTRSAKSYGSQK